MSKFFRNLVQKFRDARDRNRLLAAAEKAARTLDIMLDGREWYGGIRVVEYESPGFKVCIEVLISDSFPGTLSTFIPPRIGVTPVLIRFGKEA